MKQFFLIFILLTSLYAKEYKVVKVSDGDTINVLDGKKKLKIRFYGIDAPESKQNFGKFCTNVLKQKILGKFVSLEKKGVDTYKRQIAIVYLNNEDINAYMVKSGCAWAYTHYTKKYQALEQNARRQKVGLWIENNPENPYKFRKRNKHKRSESEEIMKIFSRIFKNA
ncbi:thermonuclease family protein [Campylobacter canadensis]|uniref:Thermonuclease family protein n=1 Tax=Campylobacter canadensis TaxID=449520 RepID=A0ABS7WSD8_9BACT|nr:thermonuclease family protein [Campylobacter canadensis]MBZ7987237.1 thermonuclease family protein [Campylobacter canadensis]MBZ7994315.1 thermonuclease family protein [Campylobacter canadensis]MBZ7996011.1 thermonuclease family protein [Campylobacter canadensis]MBZ7998334.1 thermonuclease family protein [Campylobacter canadensis]MBZ7999647.1 thermonuclease family protein [Campylobacter canadensis]